MGVVAQWVMPLFFILSGISSHYSLGGRGAGRYVGNRFKRLVMPLVFNVFVVFVPIQVWIERVSHGQFHGSFAAFYPHYFDGLYAFGGNFAWMGLHLWYLEMLFLFTLPTLPVFLALKRASRAVAAAAGVLSRGGMIFLPGLLLFAMELLVNLQPDGVGMRAFGGWSPLSYLLIYVMGFIVAIDGRFRESMERCRFQALGLGVVTTGLIILVYLGQAPFGEPPAYGLRMLLRSCNTWFWLTAFLGLGSRHLNFSNAFLAHAREAVLPFYVLHQTVIVVIGFLLIPWNVGGAGEIRGSGRDRVHCHHACLRMSHPADRSAADFVRHGSETMTGAPFQVVSRACTTAWQRQEVATTMAPEKACRRRSAAMRSPRRSAPRPGAI